MPGNEFASRHQNPPLPLPPGWQARILRRKFPGLYNARRDNLEKFWGEQFGTHHAILVVESFYENVKRHTMEHRERLAGEMRRRGAARLLHFRDHLHRYCPAGISLQLNVVNRSQ
jgi:hypothetical protein